MLKSLLKWFNKMQQRWYDQEAQEMLHTGDVQQPILKPDKELTATPQSRENHERTSCL
jgi:hypothetical protein